jgi:hypothetical protein
MSTRVHGLAGGRSLLAGIAALALLGLASGCKEEFSDERFGVLDLATFYDGGTQTNPAAGVPTEIRVATGYVGGQAVEVYDFGLVPPIINSSVEPIGVRVMAMYFFFDQKGNPLFSRPIREQRDGTDWMRGGKGLLDPNPKDFCADQGADPVQCKASNAEERQKSYSLRRRDYLPDKNRGGTADYQRPIVDVIPSDNSPPKRQYTGLWEIIEVKVPSGYDVDAIKSLETLNKALESGKFTKRATGKVINCPIVDERTAVPRGVTSRRIFFPRIELWYRRELAFCFLANGWQTLGDEAGVPWAANKDDERLDTFDVSRVTVGGSTELSVNVARAYQPATFTANELTGATVVAKRFPDNYLISGKPRSTRGDAGGYTPMTWMFDVPAPIDYVIGSWQSIADIDTSRVAPMAPTNRVRNLVVRGGAVPCGHPKYTVGGRPQCGKPVGGGFPVSAVDARNDPKCNAERDPLNPKDAPLECNKDTCFCDAPFVGYGQACSAGVAQCSPEADMDAPAFAPHGYKCFPPWGGFCQRACDPSEPNTHAAQNMGKEIQFYLDSRCGDIPGMFCLPSLQTCIKFCDQNVTDPSQCSAVLPVNDQLRETQAGQICQDFGLPVCAWPDTYTPEPFFE